MSRVHSLKHVKRFCTPHLANNDAIWPHSQRAANELANRNFSLALRVRVPGFETNEIRHIYNLQLCGILNCDDPLVLWYKIG
ncbi:hypothetical protein D3C80_1631170 [compost metagenome]